MTQALLHALNIGTLANWLTIAVFGTVAVVIPSLRQDPGMPQVQETQVIEQDFKLGEPAYEEATASSSAAAAEPESEAAESLPAPPEMPEMAAFPEMQEIPIIPAAAAAPEPPQVKPAAQTTPSTRKSSTQSANRVTGTGSSASGPSGSSGNGQGTSIQSTASRLAGGRMPQPSYPASARRSGQTGTVVIEFTIDTTGRVISAYAKVPSPWPVLNEEAVRTVRRWSFPAGGIMKIQRPIVFKLR